MSDYKATVPTEEDIRAARFYVQVEEEASRDRISHQELINGRYNTAALRAFYKRGAAVLVRYNLILSPEFAASEVDQIASLEELYQKNVSGPLIRFNKQKGKRGRFAGLVLKDRPGNVETEDERSRRFTILPDDLGTWW